MKKIINMFMTVMAVILTVIFTADYSEVNAAEETVLGSGEWTTATSDAIGFYDLNNSGSVNVLDLVLAKNNLLTESGISIKDLIIIQNYLTSGKLPDIKYYECDMLECSEENDTLLKEATSGFLTEWRYQDKTLYTRYIKSGTVYELRFYYFENPESFIPEPEFVSSIGDFAEVWKYGEFQYIINENFIYNTAVVGSNEILNFDESNILKVLTKLDEKSTMFYLDRGNYIEKVELLNTSNPNTFEKFINHDSIGYLICREEPNGPICRYSKAWTYINLYYMTPNAETAEEFHAESLDFMDRVNGELIQYNVQNNMIFIRNSETSLTVLDMNSFKFGDSKYIIKEWELDGKKYVLGVSEDNEFIWDASSTFVAG